jgi:tetratricopeptide (TPR) repeat protein
MPPATASAATGGSHPMRTLVLCLAVTCLSGATVIAPTAHAADVGSVSESPEMTKARADIKARRYDAALAELKVLVVRSPTADVFSLLGHALWKTGDPSQGMVYYNKALALDPSHKGALEYQGELFVELGQIDKANENLAKLKHLCWFGCEEASDLKEAIEHAPKRR